MQDSDKPDLLVKGLTVTTDVRNVSFRSSDCFAGDGGQENSTVAINYGLISGDEHEMWNDELDANEFDADFFSRLMRGVFVGEQHKQDCLKLQHQHQAIPGAEHQLDSVKQSSERAAGKPVEHHQKKALLETPAASLLLRAVEPHQQAKKSLPQSPAASSTPCASHAGTVVKTDAAQKRPKIVFDRIITSEEGSWKTSETSGRKVLTVPAYLIGCVIGHGGGRIQSVIVKTDTVIGIGPRAYRDEFGKLTRTITITGDPNNVQNAVKLIDQFISDEKNDLAKVSRRR